MLAVLVVSVVSACSSPTSSPTTLPNPSTTATSLSTTSSSSTTTAASTLTTSTVPTLEECSVVGLPNPQVMPDRALLPNAVEAMRYDIIEAAMGCDLDRLAALALDGPTDFFYGIGYIGDPREFWFRAEAEGREPLRLLVCLFSLLVNTAPVEDGPTLFIWPDAMTIPWSELPASSKQALRECIGDERFNAAEVNSEYLGPRIFIDETGDWVAFVLGGD